MANDLITTLHPDQDPDTNLYPNIKKDNIPNGSINRSKLDDSVNNLLNSINQLKPSGVNTSTNILAFTTNKGIYIGSDTGHWYYWDGTHYVDGGVYQATGYSPDLVNYIEDESIYKPQLDNEIPNIIKEFTNNGLVPLNYTKDLQAYLSANYRVNSNSDSITRVFALENGKTYKLHFSKNCNYRWYGFTNVTDVEINSQLLTCTNVGGSGYDVTDPLDIEFTNSNNYKWLVVYYGTKDNTYPRFNNVELFTSQDTYFKKDDNNLIKSSNIFLNTTPTSPYNDFNTIPVNTIVCYNNLTDVLNKPTNNTGVVLTYNYTNRGNINGNIQLYMDMYSNVYMRIYYNFMWQDWVKVYNNTYDDYLKCFLKIGAVGDSLSSGACNDTPSTAIDLYDYSWVQYIARKCGTSGYNFSKGGLTTRSWLTDDMGLTKALIPENKCQIYICWLGTNDVSNLGLSYLGDITDINDEDPDLSANTFYGNYGKIIYKLKEISNNCIIILFTLNNLSGGSTRGAFNDAIRNIANHFDNNVYLVDIASDQFYNSSNFPYGQKRSIHYSAIGYSKIADHMYKLINNVLGDHIEDLGQIEFIGTDYHYDN